MTASLEKQSAWGVWLVNIDQRTDDFHQKQYAWGETPFNNQRDRNGKGVGWLLDRGSNHLTARVRQDKDDLFGSKNTSSIAYGYGGDLGWRTVVSVASSYRVPTLEQLYSDYGLITLRPEMGKHWELSIRRVQSGQRTELTAYRSRLKDMITPDSFGIVGNCAATQFCYRNVDEVEIRGVTFSHETQWDRIHGKLSFDWLKPIDLSTGKLLNMRAKESLSFVAQYDADDWVHSISLKAIGRRYSSKNEKNPLPGYATIDVASRKLLSKNSQAWIKVSNLFDKRVKVSDLYMNGVDFLYAPPTTLTLGIRKNFD
jgi:vitamin B12 transporter